jgi:GT2 family glycosyltransferase
VNGTRSADGSPASWVAGIVAHAAYDELETCLTTVKSQSLSPDAILVSDTGVDRGRLAALAAAHPGVSFESRENRGWGAGVNCLLSRVERLHPDAAYVLILNPDVELAPDFAATLARACEYRPRIALASGKLLRPGGAILDSAGIHLPRHRRPRDRGSEEPDRGRYERAELLFGVSGAAMWMRRSALADLAIDGEVADEDFFAYQDDTDLCWRANLLGWQVLYEPAAVAIHRRGWRRARRNEIDVGVRRHSFKNHYLQIIKNERGIDLLKNLPWVAVWEVLRLGFAILRDPAILPGYRAAWRAAPRAFRKRRSLHARARQRSGVAALDGRFPAPVLQEKRP